MIKKTLGLVFFVCLFLTIYLLLVVLGLPLPCTGFL